MLVLINRCYYKVPWWLTSSLHLWLRWWWHIITDTNIFDDSMKRDTFIHVYLPQSNILVTADLIILQSFSSSLQWNIISYFIDLSINLKNGEDGTVTTSAPHKLTVWTGMVFIVGEMAGSGVLALPSAIENTGRCLGIEMHIERLRLQRLSRVRTLWRVFIRFFTKE